MIGEGDGMQGAWGATRGIGEGGRREGGWREGQGEMSGIRGVGRAVRAPGPSPAQS